MRKVSHKIRTKSEQIALSLLLGTLSVAACVYVVYSYYRSVDIHIGRIAESSLSATASEVGGWARAKREKIELLAQALEALNGSPAEIADLVRRAKDGDKDVVDIFYGSAENPEAAGFATYATDWVAPAGYDWTTRRWFVEARKNGGLTTTAPYKDLQTDKTIITISKPVFIKGVFRGVIASDVSTSSVMKIIDGVYTAGGADVRLIDGEGGFISTDNGQIAAGLNAFELPRYKPWKKQILSGEFSMRTDLLGNRYYANIGLKDLGWTMLADGSLSSFEDIRETVLRFSAILLFLAALFIFMLFRTWGANTKLLEATKEIELANRVLEETVAERTASLKNILDNAEEGFLTFGAELIIDPNYSRGCAAIFGKDIRGLSVPDVVFPGMTQTIEDFRRGFELYFNGKSKAEIIFDLTEKQTTIQGRIIRIAYKETAGQKILCILTDVTLELETAEKNRQEAENQQRILRAIHNRHFFAQFLENSEHLFGNLEVYSGHEPSPEEKTELMRQIHTFKGDAGFFAFSETQNISHECETLANDSVHLGTAVSYKEMLIQIRKAYFKELKTITDTMGDRWLDESLGVTMPRDEYRKLTAYLKKKEPNDAKLHLFLDSFQKMPLSELFSRLPFAAAVAAERLGKRIKPMAIHGGALKLVPDQYLAFVDSCIHIVNNMVDHGIEYPYEREAMQKAPEGVVEMTIAVEKASMVLEFKDDGRGLNPKEIERAAKKSGLVPEGRSLQNAELFALLFQDGFSTRAEASTTSGRGIGLAAVRAETEKLGGTIEVRSKLGKGTVFEITLPIQR